MIAVAVVDDHDLVAEGLVRLLEAAPSVQVAGRHRSGEELLAQLGRGAHVNVCLIDLSMPGMGGAATIREVSSRRDAPACIAVTATVSGAVAADALASGARGFVTKCQPAEVLLAAIERCAAGGTFVDPAVQAQLDDLRSTRAAPLSEREFEVMRRLAVGQRITTIADELYLSPKTVSTHRRRILDKLGLSSNAELALYALQQGVIGS